MTPPGFAVAGLALEGLPFAGLGLDGIALPGFAAFEGLPTLRVFGVIVICLPCNHLQREGAWTHH
jgi:hypothetical protein